MLARAFPRVEIISGESASPEIRAAFTRADLFLHGSGSGVVARAHLEAWKRATRKPYAIFGIILAAQSEASSAALDPGLVELLAGALRVGMRETTLLGNATRAGLTNAAFVPDAPFACDLRDDARAARWPKDALVVIPRLRFTPYHLIRMVSWGEAEIQRRTAINDRHAAADAAKLRTAIEAWTAETGKPVLLAVEMTYHLDLLRPLLYDPLPAAAKRRVSVLDHYWLTGEAAAVYRRAAVVLSCGCHSPILAAVQGTPALYLHQPEDGIKGRMWEDLGLGGRYAEIERTTGEEVARRVLDLGRGKDARRRVRGAVERAQGLQRKALAALGPALRLA